MVHNPKNDIAASIANRDSRLWESWYQGFFADFSSARYMPHDKALQQSGVDTVVTLANGWRFLIEEKERKTDYGDIALEYWSAFERGVPGWIEKKSRAHYIAYAVLPSRACYFLPILLLQSAWAENKQAWFKRYKRIEARNEGYTSISIAVPVGHLLRAMGLSFKECVVVLPERG